MIVFVNECCIAVGGREEKVGGECLGMCREEGGEGRRDQEQHVWLVMASKSDIDYVVVFKLILCIIYYTFFPPNISSLSVFPLSHFFPSSIVFLSI